MDEQVVPKGVDSARERSKLLEDLRKMVNNPDYADISFLCQDGECVLASRLLLVARSPVFKKMLMNGMAETHQSVILMPNISSSVLLVILEFLHVGADIRERLLKTPVLQLWSTIFAVISAARFFMLDALKAIAYGILWTDLVESKGMPYTDQVVRMFGSRLSAACEFASLLNDDIEVGKLDIICMELVEFLRSADLTEDHLETFCEQGFCNYMLNTESTVEVDDGRASLGDYVRIRQVIMWCNTRIPQELHLRDLDSYLPTSRKVTSLLNDNEARKDFESEFLDLNHHLWWGKVLQDLPPFLVMKLLPPINLSLLHPAILMRLIEPLKVFEQTQVMNALKEHATLSFDWNYDLNSTVATPFVRPWHFLQGCYLSTGEEAIILLRGTSDTSGSAISGFAIPVTIWSL